MKTKRNLVVMIVLGFCSLCYPWKAVFDSTNLGYPLTAAYDGFVADDSNYIILGASSSIGDNNTDGLGVIKLDRTGKKIWFKRFLTDSAPYPSPLVNIAPYPNLAGMVQAENGCFFLVGSAKNSIICGSSIDSKCYDMFIIRCDSAGNMLGLRRYSLIDSVNMVVAAVAKLNKNAYVAVGSFVQGSRKVNNDAFMMAFDSTGDTLWSRIITSSSINSEATSIRLFDVRKIDENRAVVCGAVGLNTNVGVGYSAIIKFDSKETITQRLFSSYYSGSSCSGQNLLSICLTSDTAVAMAGSASYNYYCPGTHDPPQAIIRTGNLNDQSGNGDSITHTYDLAIPPPSSGNLFVTGIFDKSIMSCGYQYVNNTFKSNITKLNSLAETVIWRKSFGNGYPYRILVVEQPYLLLVGWVADSGAGGPTDSRGCVQKIDADGNDVPATATALPQIPKSVVLDKPLIRYNPFSHSLTFTVNNVPAAVSVMNLNGRVVKSLNIKNRGIVSWKTDEIAAGCYIAIARTAQGVCEKKFVAAR